MLTKSYYSVLVSKNDEEKKRFSVLAELNYVPEDEDQVVVDYLRDGYVDFESRKALLEEKNEQKRIGDINQKHREIWAKFRSNFQTTQEKFVRDQIAFLKKHVSDLGIASVASTVKFLQGIDDTVDLSDVLDQSIDLLVSKTECFDRHDVYFMDMDREVLFEIEKRMEEKTQKYTITELIEALSDRDGYNPSDFSYLHRFSEDDFYEWAESSDADNLVFSLRYFFERFGNLEGEDSNVMDRLRSALKRLKARSNLDAARVDGVILQKKRNQ